MKKFYKVAKTKTDIPTSLLDEIQSNQSNHHSKHSLLQPKRKNARKEMRRQKKLEKKMKRLTHSKPTTPYHMSQNKSNAKEKSNKPLVTSIPSKVNGKSKKDDDELSKKSKNSIDPLETFKSKNPHLYERLVASDLIHDESFKKSIDQGIDKEISRYSKLLGKKSLKKQLEMDGLDELLGQEFDYARSKSESESDLDTNSNSNEVLKNDQEKLKLDDSDLDVASSDNELDNDVESELEDDSYMENESDMDSHSQMDSEMDSQMEIELETQSQQMEIETEMNNVKKKQSQSKYIPPALRRTESQNENQIKLLKQIKGLVNRLSDNNIESILGNIEECYRTNPRHDVNQVLCNTLIQMVGDDARLNDAFIQTYAVFIVCLYHVIGIEFGSHLVIQCFEQIQQEQLESKTRNNLLTLLGYLYSFGLLSCHIIYDYVRLAIKSLQEQDVEILSRLLKICGSQMRSDDPSALKEIILLLKQEMNSRSNLSQRLVFMADSIMDLKNNKKKNKDQGSTQERFKKFITNYIKKRHLNGTESLRIGIQDLKDIATKGKWWLVGSAWTGNENQETQDTNTQSQESSSNLLALAKQLKMNTEIRKSIFVALMSSEDYVDAFERIVKLRLKDKQEREIIRVLVHVCGSESVFNPYYALVGQKLCESFFSFKITAQYTLWDMFKALNEDEYQGREGIRRVSNIAKFYRHLILSQTLGLSILKSFNFVSINVLQVLMIQIILGGVLACKSTLDMQEIFEKANQTSQEFRQGLCFFLEQYLSKSKSNIPELENMESQELKSRIKVIKKCLLK